MAKKAQRREDAWMQCSECGDLNYRTNINVMGGAPKLELQKYCPRERKRTLHKLRRK